MADSIRIQDMTAAQISEFLNADGSTLSDSQAAALRDFIEHIGGVENALLAVEMLEELEKAA